MDIRYYVIIVIISVIIICITITTLLWYYNPYYFVKWWNESIKTECDDQDKNPLNGIQSYHNVLEYPNKTVTQMHQLIRINHDVILAEVLETIPYYNGFSMDDSDYASHDHDSNHQHLNYDSNRQHSHWFMNENKWRPIWVRFMGEWAGSADRLPTLKQIISLFPEIPILYVSIFYPGSTLVEHKNAFRAVHRYHYGLKIPDGDIGLKIAGFDVKWKEKEGFIWDDTLPHSAWNHTLEPRIVIFADIPRDLSYVHNIISKMMYAAIKQSKEVIQIKNMLEHEGIVIH